MRIQIKPSRGEYLRMKYRTRLFEVNQALNAAWWIAGIVNGEMAQYYIYHDIDCLEEYRDRLQRALNSTRLKGKLP